LRHNEEFVCDRCRLIGGREPECPELQCPQTIYNNETEYRPDTQGDKVTRSGIGKEEQADTGNCAHAFEACQYGDSRGALTAVWIHIFLFSNDRTSKIPLL